MKKLLYTALLLLYLSPLSFSQQVLFNGDKYKLFWNSVKQDSFEAQAIDENTIRSNYTNVCLQGLMRPIAFKFSINGLDNERAPAQDHKIFFDPDDDGRFVTPLFSFGKPDPEGTAKTVSQNKYMIKKSEFDVTFRVDMREVLKDFKEKGFFKTYDGAVIKKDEFKDLYIAGDTQPLTWEFSALVKHPELKLDDRDHDGIYEVTLHFANDPYRELDGKGYAYWKLKKNIHQYPRFKSSVVLLNALYNMSLEEMMMDKRDDGAFSAGLKWTGVWTRDISYSIILSLAAVDPDGSKTSLMAKVKNGKIIQDTGTGGSWPISTDRSVWALAAWEIYLTTGDIEWLKKVYPIIKKTAEDDLKTIIDPKTQMVYGESSFLDWREQTYPEWMDPKDIFKSQCLGTNAVHFQAFKILGNIAQILGEDGQKYLNTAENIKTGMLNYLWMKDKGYFAQFLYGRNYYSRSPKSEALGEALSVLFDIAGKDEAESIIRNTPVVSYGVPCIFPNIPGLPSYHNNAVWPFVETYFTWASKKVNNPKSVEFGLASVFRSSALFLTNKENLLASTGHYDGTEINSDRQLWSVAGTIASIYRIIFGLEFQKDCLVISPFVPEAYNGSYELSGVKFRNAVLDISVEGFGQAIKQIIFDGQEISSNKFNSDISGHHSIKISLDGNIKKSEINLVENYFAPLTPRLTIEEGKLKWNSSGDGLSYEIIKNGKAIKKTDSLEALTEAEDEYSEYQVKAIDKKGCESFLSEPVVAAAPKNLVSEFEPDKAYLIKKEQANFNGDGYIELSKNSNTEVEFKLNLDSDGVYAVDFRYANGSGPLNTKNMCAIRTLVIDDKTQSTITFPQRGDLVWDNWGYSNSVIQNLSKGNHTLKVKFNDFNNNMNDDVNTALLDCLRVTRLQRN